MKFFLLKDIRQTSFICFLIFMVGSLSSCGTTSTRRENAHGSRQPNPADPTASPLETSKNDSKTEKDFAPLNERGFASSHERGLASWYGKSFRGRKTASGERFDPKLLTAAHRTLPLGSMAKVTCPESGKTVVVKINDRGPFSSHRLIDLSYAAAKKLGIVRKGIALVQVEPIR